MGLAYEIVINSDPLHRLSDGGEHPHDAGPVIAHAATATTPSSRAIISSNGGPVPTPIIDYLVFAGTTSPSAREARLPRSRRLVNACRTLNLSGSIAYKRSPKLSLENWSPAPADREAISRPRSATSGEPCPSREVVEMQRKSAASRGTGKTSTSSKERPAPGTLAAGVVRIVRKIGQYFIPTPDPGDERGLGHLLALHLLNTLYDEGKLADGFMIEFLQSHTNVVQPPYSSPRYRGSIPMPWASPCGATSAGSARTPTTRPRGSRTSPAPTGGNLRFRHEELQDEIRRPIPLAPG